MLKKTLLSWDGMELLLSEHTDLALVEEQLPAITKLKQAREQLQALPHYQINTTAYRQARTAYDACLQQLSDFIRHTEVVGWPFDPLDAYCHAVAQNLDFRIVQVSE